MCNIVQFDTSICYNVFARDTPYWVCTLILCNIKTTNHEHILHGLDNDFAYISARRIEILYLNFLKKMLEMITEY